MRPMFLLYLAVAIFFALEIKTNDALGLSSTDLEISGKSKLCAESCAFAAAYAQVSCHAEACVKCPKKTRYCSGAKSYSYAYASAFACAKACMENTPFVPICTQNRVSLEATPSPTPTSEGKIATPTPTVTPRPKLTGNPG